MCGIFGYIGGDNSHQEVKLGLERLAYRGYDSAGIVSIVNNKFEENKCLGHPEELLDSDIKSNLSIGHNRWATHGEPSVLNAHPHFSNDKKIALVHNGIIENYCEINKFLKKNGFSFYSDTDTELIPNLIQHYMKNLDIVDATIAAMNHIRGAYAMVFVHIDYPNQINVARLGSPVCLGRSDSGSICISSDTNSLPLSTKEVMTIDDGKLVIANSDGNIIVKNLEGNTLEHKFETASIKKEKNYEIGDFSHFLEKEIYEQPIYLRNALSGRVNLDKGLIKLSGISDYIEDILNAEDIIYTGCGSAYYAACIGAQAMESIARKRVRAMSAGELKYYNPVMNEKTVLIAISQSGETADTIGCIKMAKNHGVTTLGVINVVNSTISRMVDAGVYIRAGEEVSVASTKSVTNQIVTMLSLAILVGSKKDLSILRYESLISELHSLPNIIDTILTEDNKIQRIAKKYANYNNVLCIGRGYLKHVAKEAALKIKELSYIHAEGYSAAELKHGPLALIDKSVPTLALITSGPMEEKMLSNIREIKSRGGKVIGIVNSDVSKETKKVLDDIIEIPSCSNKMLNSLTFLVPCQLLSYYLARENGHHIDRPRNLAKSVTVE